MRYYSSTASEKTLSSAVSSTDTEIGLNNTTGLPASYPFTLVLDPDTASEEIVLVTGAGATKTYAVTRGSDVYQGVTGGNGTSKTTHASGASVKHMVTARDLQEPQTHMAASSGVHGVTGSVVGTSDAQTLTNKTISSSNNTITVSQSSVTNLTSDLALKAPLASPTFTGAVTLPTGATGVTIGNVNGTEISYLDGVTSAIQTQLDAKAPLANPVFTTGIQFEGSTANDFETTLTVTDPTADRTITLPDASGTVALTANTGITGTNSTAVINPSSTSYVNGISVTFIAPPSGKVAIHHHAFINVTDTSGGACSIRLQTSGTDVTNYGTGDERGYIASQKGATAGSGNAAMAGVVFVTGLTAGTSYTAYQQYKATDATGVEITKRELLVVPSL